MASEFPRINESVRAATWLLSRSPEEGKRTGAPLSQKYRMLIMGPPIENYPRIWIAYSFEDNVVTLEDIQVLPITRSLNKP